MKPIIFWLEEKNLTRIGAFQDFHDGLLVLFRNTRGLNDLKIVAIRTICFFYCGSGASYRNPGISNRDIPGKNKYTANFESLHKIINSKRYNFKLENAVELSRLSVFATHRGWRNFDRRIRNDLTVYLWEPLMVHRRTGCKRDNHSLRGASNYRLSPIGHLRYPSDLSFVFGAFLKTASRLYRTVISLT